MTIKARANLANIVSKKLGIEIVYSSYNKVFYIKNPEGVGAEAIKIKFEDLDMETNLSNFIKVNYPEVLL